MISEYYVDIHDNGNISECGDCLFAEGTDCAIVQSKDIPCPESGVWMLHHKITDVPIVAEKLVSLYRKRPTHPRRYEP